MTRLNRLEVSYNQLTGDMKYVYYCHEIHFSGFVFYFSFELFWLFELGAIPSFLGLLSSLWQLDLSSIFLSGTKLHLLLS